MKKSKFGMGSSKKSGGSKSSLFGSTKKAGGGAILVSPSKADRKI